MKRTRGGHEEIAAALARVPQWRGVPREVLDELARASQWRECRAGELLFRQGERARSFFVVAAGTVRVYRSHADGREQLVHLMRAGTSFAEPAALALGAYPASAAALEPRTAVVAIDGARFQRLLGADSRVASAIVAALSARLMELVDRIEDLSTVGAEARLARYVLRLPSARDERAALCATLPIAKKELAAQLAMTPETLSRVLQRWSRAGWLRVDGPRLELERVDALLSLADGAAA